MEAFLSFYLFNYFHFFNGFIDNFPLFKRKTFKFCKNLRINFCRNGYAFLATLYFLSLRISKIRDSIIDFIYLCETHSNLFNGIVFGLWFLYSMTFYILSWKLRKINIKIQLNPSSYPEEYSLVMKTLLDTSIRAEFDANYASLMQKWPQFARCTKHLYKEQLKKSI